MKRRQGPRGGGRACSSETTIIALRLLEAGEIHSSDCGGKTLMGQKKIKNADGCGPGAGAHLPRAGHEAGQVLHAVALRVVPRDVRADAQSNVHADVRGRSEPLLSSRKPPCSQRKWQIKRYLGIQRTFVVSRGQKNASRRRKNAMQKYKKKYLL